MKRILNKILLSTYLVLMVGAASAQIAPLTVTVTGVAVNSDSFKVDYQAIPSAGDYRIYDVSNPTHVKYAGIVHPTVGGRVLSIPSLEIEQNGVTPGIAHTYVIEAVDKLGPSPKCNLYSVTNSHQFPEADAGNDMMCVLGDNSGPTTDGNVSTNGQGPWDNVPIVIALSQPFVVTCSGKSVFDTFASATITPTGSRLPTARLWTYDMVTPVTSYDVGQLDCDNNSNSIFVMNHHLMDVTFDGYESRSGNPMHIAHGVTFFSPVDHVDISGGKMLHATMEVDAHVNARRWIAFNLSPGNDPLQNWYSVNASLNSTNTAVFVQVFSDTITVMQFTGSDAKGLPVGVSLVGAAGQAPISGYRVSNGRGIDNRSRFDLFATVSHFAVYEDGRRVCEGDWKAPLFTNVKTYFTHYVYHTALGQQELEQYAPYETYWHDVTPYSDLRHWSGLGSEVLPTTATFASVAALAQTPAFVPPTFVAATESLGLPSAVSPLAADIVALQTAVDKIKSDSK